MNKWKYLMLLVAVCLLLTGCHPKQPTDTTTKPTSSDGVSVEDPTPELLEFNYGRLTLENRFVKLSGNGIDFTLNFAKKIITPNDDIVLTVYAVLRDGTQWYHSFDVTEQMHEDGGHAIHIVLDHLPIPEPGPGIGEGGGGFIPTIDDWNTIDINISM